MNIRYEFLTGETIEIEVSDNIAVVAIEIERETYNSNRKETRRHNSIEDMQSLGVQFKDIESDTAKIVGEKENKQTLHNALDKLLPQQKELIHKVYFREMSIIEIACAEGVSEAAVRNRLNKIYKKLKNIII